MNPNNHDVADHVDILETARDGDVVTVQVEGGPAQSHPSFSLDVAAAARALATTMPLYWHLL